MQIVIDDLNRFKGAFNAISGLICDALIKVDNKGLRLGGLDPSHIAFAGLDLKPEFFDTFIIDKPKEELFVDMEELSEVLNRAQEDDLLYITRTDTRLILTFENMERRTFELLLIKNNSFKPPSKPELEFPAFVEVPSKSFKLAVEDAVTCNDATTFKLDKDKLYLDTKGEFKDCKFEYLHGEKIKGDFKSMHAVHKLKEMVKACEFADVCKIGMGNDVPLSLEFESNTQDGITSFLLAPRIESEE